MKSEVPFRRHATGLEFLRNQVKDLALSLGALLGPSRKVHHLGSRQHIVLNDLRGWRYVAVSRHFVSVRMAVWSMPVEVSGGSAHRFQILRASARGLPLSGSSQRGLGRREPI